MCQCVMCHCVVVFAKSYVSVCYLSLCRGVHTVLCVSVLSVIVSWCSHCLMCQSVMVFCVNSHCIIMCYLLIRFLTVMFTKLCVLGDSFSNNL